MPSTFVPAPAFPTVPQVPGVPPLNLDPTAVFTSLVPVSFDVPGLSGFASGARWGIYTTGGQPALVADSVQGVEYQRDYRISDAPQENGAFMSYNKVRTPYQARVTYLIADSVAARSNFLQAAEAVASSLDLFAVVTPEITYPSANVTHLSYRRVAQGGVTLLRVEIWCQEVRIVGQGQLANGQSANSAPTQNNGTTQPVEAATDGAGNPVTPSGMSVGNPQPSLTTGLPAPTGTTPSTTLGTTVGTDFGTRLITNPIVDVPPGLRIAEPDVATPDPPMAYEWASP